MKTTAGLVCIGLALMACGTTSVSGPPSMEGSWSGAIDGTDAYVAVVASQDRLVVYACDSGAIHDWFAVAASSNVAATANGLSLSASPSGDGWRGQLTLADGSSHAFVADRSAATVLFRAEGENPDVRWVGGWIDRGGAGQRGTLLVDRSGSTTQLSPTLTTTTLTLSSTGGVGGLTVKAIDPSAIPTTTAVSLASAQWTASGRVRTAASAAVPGVSVRFLTAAGGLLGSARSGTDGTYRLAMSVPAQPIAVTNTVAGADGSSLPQSSASTTQSAPGGSSTIDIRLQ